MTYAKHQTKHKKVTTKLDTEGNLRMFKTLGEPYNSLGTKIH